MNKQIQTLSTLALLVLTSCNAGSKTSPANPPSNPEPAEYQMLSAQEYFETAFLSAKVSCDVFVIDSKRLSPSDTLVAAVEFEVFPATKTANLDLKSPSGNYSANLSLSASLKTESVETEKGRRTGQRAVVRLEYAADFAFLTPDKERFHESSTAYYIELAQDKIAKKQGVHQDHVHFATNPRENMRYLEGSTYLSCRLLTEQR